MPYPINSHSLFRGTGCRKELHRPSHRKNLMRNICSLYPRRLAHTLLFHLFDTCFFRCNSRIQIVQYSRWLIWRQQTKSGFVWVYLVQVDTNRTGRASRFRFYNAAPDNADIAAHSSLSFQRIFAIHHHLRIIHARFAVFARTYLSLPYIPHNYGCNTFLKMRIES